MSAKLSTHVLDLTRGAPAVGMEIELWSLTETPAQLKVVVTNAEGRTDLLIPIYTYVLLAFFFYCYPIARWTRRLEARYAER